jgi:hypothetical protein
MLTEVQPQTTQPRQFGLAFNRFFRVLTDLGGHGPGASVVEVTAETVRVRSGWVFAVELPIAAIVAAAPSRNPWWNIGGIQTSLRGTWAVCGAYRGIVALALDPAATGRLFSRVPIRVKRLLLSLDDPEGFLATLKA